ncbi:YoaK family protein [Wenjunlia tyrosinilytica]|uniref:YoaK family protein n=1 Tax=Wenjunlia tyrosinilytica TaxID=1544741 RepID=UPI001E46339B|nr:YoaK family protein [Wenjunlia tyrosinilytica]
MAVTRGLPLTAVLVGLTVTTGMVEAVSYLALGHVFTAMMTGNLLLLSFACAGGGGLSVAASSVSFGAFVAGAGAGARLEAALGARRHRWFVIALVVEAVILAAAGLTAWRIEPVQEQMSGRYYGVVALVAAAMGIRSVTMLRADIPDLATTVATRLLTALVNGVFLGAGHGPDRPAAERREAHRGATVAAMFAGGLLGAWLLHLHWRPYALLLLVGAVVLVIAGAYAFSPRHRRL